MNKKTIIISIVAIIIIAAGAGVWQWEKVKKNKEIKNAENKQQAQDEQNNLNQPSQQISNDHLVWYEIPELGIEFKVSESNENDLIYYYKDWENGNGTAYFSTKTLENFDKNCSPEKGSPLGTITKKIGIVDKKDIYFASRNPLQFEDFFLFFEGPQASCVNNKETKKGSESIEFKEKKKFDLSNFYKTVREIK